MKNPNVMVSNGKTLVQFKETVNSKTKLRGYVHINTSGAHKNRNRSGPIKLRNGTVFHTNELQSRTGTTDK